MQLRALAAARAKAASMADAAAGHAVLAARLKLVGAAGAARAGLGCICAAGARIQADKQGRSVAKGQLALPGSTSCRAGGRCAPVPCAGGQLPQRGG